MTGQPLVVTIHAHHDAYEDDHPAFRSQVGRLETELVREVDGAQRVRHAVPGTKGTYDELILALGQAGVLTLAVEMFRGWLARDRDRSIEIVWTEDGQEQRVVARGEAISAEALAPLVEAAAARVGENAWARSATAPS